MCLVLCKCVFKQANISNLISPRFAFISRKAALNDCELSLIFKYYPTNPRGNLPYQSVFIAPLKLQKKVDCEIQFKLIFRSIGNRYMFGGVVKNSKGRGFI